MFLKPACWHWGLSYLLIFVLAGIFSSCATPDRYTLSSIQADYAGAASVEDDVWAGVFEINGTGLKSPESTNAPMTIRDVLFITLKNNPDLNQAQARIQEAAAMTDIVKAAFWPSLGFYTEYMQGDAPSSYLFKKIDQRKLPQEADFNEPGWFENYESGLHARMNLFNGGKDYLAVQMAKKGEMIADLDRQALENLLITRVITSFYDALAAGEFVKIAEKSVQTISEHLRMMQVRLEGGGALKSDVLSLEVRLARAKEQLLSSKNHYEIALASLFNLMGLDSGFINDDTEALEKSFLDTPLLPETFTDGFVHALKHRPEIASIRRKLIQLRMEVDSAKSSYLPSLDLMMKYYVADPEMKYDLDRENWIAAVILNWDFFSGFATQASVRRAESALKEMLAADQKQLLKIRLDVKTAYLNRQEAESRYEVAGKAVESAEESFRIVKNHYLGGSVPVTRFLEAELDLNKARIHVAVAYYDREKASAEIARTVGLWSSQAIFPK